MHSATTISLLLALASTSFAQTADAETQVGDLRLEPSNIDRISYLGNDTDYIFNFLNPPSGVTTGAGGHTVAASAENFPAVTGNGVSMTIGFLGPCSMNTPHTHPRATEINYSVNTTLRAGFLAENGARFVEINLNAGSAAIFPQGAIHFEMNPSCESAMFVAAFNSEDPGVQQTAQRFFGLPPDIVGAALGGLGIEEVFGLEALLPDNVAIATEECLQRCNLTRPARQPTTQRQPRVKGNSFLEAALAEAGAKSPKLPTHASELPIAYTVSALPTPTGTKAAAAEEKIKEKIGAPKPTPLVSSGSEDVTLDTAGNGQAATTVQDDVDSVDSGIDSMEVLKPLLITLVALNAVILVGMVAMTVVYVRNPTRKAKKQEKLANGQYLLPRKMLLKSDMYRDDSASTSPYSSPSFSGSYPTTPESAMRKF